MGYLDFHMTYIVPPVALAMVLVADQRAERRRRVFEAAALLAALATLWATPWDNYMVAEGVWSYPPDAVVGTIGYIPVEEQLFFVLQPLLAVCLLGLIREYTGLPEPLPNRARWRRWGYAASAAVAAAAAGAVWLHLSGRATYLGAIVAWFGPVLALQVAVGFRWLAARYRSVLASVAAPSLYLCLVDAIAIDQSYWTIEEEATVGIVLAGLPIEEIVFFWITNGLVVGGAALYLDWEYTLGPLTKFDADDGRE